MLEFLKFSLRTQRVNDIEVVFAIRREISAPDQAIECHQCRIDSEIVGLLCQATADSARQKQILANLFVAEDEALNGG